MSEGRFTFVPPPEAPVFYPTTQEFEDPIMYIEKIKPIAFKTGICKIIPPKGWNPPFAVDIDKFRFTPRIQRLYELEAHSRLKLNFINKLFKFARLQGNAKLRIPSIGGKYLDLFWLHKYVDKAGGYERINAARLWPSIAEKLGYHGGRYASIIKANYEKLLLPFVRLCSETDARPLNKKPSELISPCKRGRNIVKDAPSIDYDANKELQNLKFYGPGPKAAIPISEALLNEAEKEPLIKKAFACHVCEFDNDEANLLICSTESCQACYHTFCLTPPLSTIPRRQWKCPECVRTICNRPMELYGFPQSNKSYSLKEFGVRADSFKAQYFRQEPSSVPCSKVEQEFWRILQEYSEDVVVEYGADIHSSDQGSGFPTELQIETKPELYIKKEQFEEALTYVRSPWNLNNLPVFGKGEPKTWYGVSSLHAEDFERAMRNQATELFDLSPDLLHHITTIMNPNLIQDEGVPIYRTDQHCGEFVITFPRAYHAGFNQGFNFAEAVNICCPDWLPMGRACVEHYASMRRQCVFSNDELLLILAEVAAGLRDMETAAMWTDLTARCFRDTSSTGFDIDALRIIHAEFTTVTCREAANRAILAAHVGTEERVRLDELPDDERVCTACQTTLFFSALTCPCKVKARIRSAAGDKRKSCESNEGGMVCLTHADSVCATCQLSECTIKYTYTTDELEEIKARLADKLVAYDHWRHEFAGFLGIVRPSDAVYMDANKTSGAEIKSEPVDQVKSYTVLTFNVLKAKLNEAEKLGYKNDILFRRATTCFQSLNELISICDRASDAIAGCFKAKANETADLSVVAFHLKRPATFTVASGNSNSVKQAFLNVNQELDLNNPREVDLIRLLEAVDQQNPPVCLNDVPSVGYLRRLLDTIQKWRSHAKEIISQSKAVFFTGAVGSSVRNFDSKTGVKSENMITSIQGKLRNLMKSLEDEFPGYCPFMEDFNMIKLLEEVCDWLTNSATLSNDAGNRVRMWSVTGLRNHLAVGESYIGRLASADASSSLRGSQDSSSPAHLRVVGSRLLRSLPLSSATEDVKAPTLQQHSANLPRLTAASVLSVFHPFLRHCRARLHTSVGKLSQTLVEVDALIALINETAQTMCSTTTTSVAHAADCINQLKCLGISCSGSFSVDGFSVPKLVDRGVGVCCCCDLQLYEAAITAVSDVSTELTRLVHWWCTQVNCHIAHDGGKCPARPTAAWLSDLSDVRAIQQFLFPANDDICTEDAQLKQLQTAFDQLLLSATSNLLMLAKQVLKKNDTELSTMLPSDLYNLLLLAGIPHFLDDELRAKILHPIQSAALSQDMSAIETAFISADRANDALISFLVSSAGGSAFCANCYRLLGFPKAKPKPHASTASCAFCRSIPRAKLNVSVEELNTICFETVLHRGSPGDDLAEVVKRSLSKLVMRYQDWLEDIVRFVEECPPKVGAFSGGALPNRLSTALSRISSSNVQKITGATLKAEVVQRLIFRGHLLALNAPQPIFDFLNWVLKLILASPA